MDIRTAREAAGLTREELADRLGTTEDTLRAWEHGLPRPLRPTMRRIERAIGGTHDRTLDRNVDRCAGPQ